MKIEIERHDSLKRQMVGMRRDRLPWWSHWRDLADYYLPRRYVWLLSEKEAKAAQLRNRFILDGTGTNAARTLASGMMNGITSPSRPWFRLRVPGVEDEVGTAVRAWADECRRRMLKIMAESNFYNGMALLYLDLVVFGTAAMTIYEDFDEVIRCFNHALGEFYVAHDERLQVTRLSREFTWKVWQVVEKFGIENVSDRVREAWNAKGNRLYDPVKIVHLIEPNDPPEKELSGRWAFREYYWEDSGTTGQMLRIAGYREFPAIVPRWEILANDSYGSSPAMDALPDVIQLQHETKKKAQALDKLVDPPLIADVQLANQPTSLLPRGITYVAGINNVGVKPIHTIDGLPLAEMSKDIAQTQARIRETLHNDLFRMISQLDTVRSATEIDARREEKLVLLGPVLERFENEALDPAIRRIFSIMLRKGLLPEPPPEINDKTLEIQYVSVLSDAQRAVATIPMERFAQFIGSLGAIVPETLDVPNWEELAREYGDALGVAAKAIRSREDTEMRRKAREEQLSAQQTANVGDVLTKSAKQLSETDVGGGANALQMMLGN